jgi:hypothetical protein
MVCHRCGARWQAAPHWRTALAYRFWQVRCAMPTLKRLRELLRRGGNDPCFGRCPDCWGTGIRYNIGAEEWFACDRCNTRWLFGVGNMSYLPEETAANARRLASYRKVLPVQVGWRGATSW